MTIKIPISTAILRFVNSGAQMLHWENCFVSLWSSSHSLFIGTTSRKTSRRLLFPARSIFAVFVGAFSSRVNLGASVPIRQFCPAITFNWGDSQRALAHHLYRWLGNGKNFAKCAQKMALSCAEANTSTRSTRWSASYLAPSWKRSGCCAILLGLYRFDWKGLTTILKIILLCQIWK